MAKDPIPPPPFDLDGLRPAASDSAGDHGHGRQAGMGDDSSNASEHRPASHAALHMHDELRDSLVGIIATEIARAISEGELAPGADLNSVELAARFGTSRTPVREALILLEKEGLVEIPPRRRPRVAHISLDEVEELYQIRAVLNGMMIDLFVRTAGHEALGGMDGFIEAMRKAVESGDVDSFYAERQRLHNLWVDNCGNASLRRLLGTWKMRMSVGRLVGRLPDYLDRSMRDHERLAIACHDREPELAVTLIKSMTLAGLAAIKKQQQARQQAAENAASEAGAALDKRRSRLHIV